MKNIALLSFLVLSLNLFAQKIDLKSFENKIGDILEVKDFEKTVFRRKTKDINNIVYAFSPNYVRINPFHFCHYLDSCSNDKRLKWNNLINSKHRLQIDSFFKRKEFEDDKIIGAIFITATYENYFIAELFYTKKYYGYECSKIIEGYRLQMLFLVEGNKISLINQKIIEKGNECLMLE